MSIYEKPLDALPFRPEPLIIPATTSWAEPDPDLFPGFNSRAVPDSSPALPSDAVSDASPVVPATVHPEPASCLDPILEATPALTITTDCDLCRKLFQTGDAYYRITLGMDDTPQYAGLPPSAESTVESTSELIVCAGCEPEATNEFNRLLETFWGLRAPDPVATELVAPRPDPDGSTELEP